MDVYTGMNYYECEDWKMRVSAAQNLDELKDVLKDFIDHVYAGTREDAIE